MARRWSRDPSDVDPLSERYGRGFARRHHARAIDFDTRNQSNECAPSSWASDCTCAATRSRTRRVGNVDDRYMDKLRALFASSAMRRGRYEVEVSAMPVRTVTEELCDICFSRANGKQTRATERVRFSFRGQDYVVLACSKHVDSVRGPLQHLVELGSVEGGNRKGRGRRPIVHAAAATTKTHFSQLSDDEKKRFRAWADLPNARRIRDSRVDEWRDAGKP